jgi:hypothetical protein
MIQTYTVTWRTGFCKPLEPRRVSSPGGGSMVGTKADLPFLFGKLSFYH